MRSGGQRGGVAGQGSTMQRWGSRARRRTRRRSWGRRLGPLWTSITVWYSTGQGNGYILAAAAMWRRTRQAGVAEDVYGERETAAVGSQQAQAVAVVMAGCMAWTAKGRGAGAGAGCCQLFLALTDLSLDRNGHRTAYPVTMHTGTGWRGVARTATPCFLDMRCDASCNVDLDQDSRLQTADSRLLASNPTLTLHLAPVAPPPAAASPAATSHASRLLLLPAASLPRPADPRRLPSSPMILPGHVSPARLPPAKRSQSA
jgi:hypothetical protein